MRVGTWVFQVRNWFRDRFVRQPKWQAFVDWQTYYRAFLQDGPGHALIDHRGPYVGDELRQVEIIDSMVSGRRVFLLSAPPGCGKSRFALELARRIGRAQRTWDVRFVRHDEAVLRAELHELRNLKRLVLVVDDAHDCPELVQLLAGACSAAEPGAPIHLLCLTRPTGRPDVTAALAAHFPVGDPLELELGRPSAKLVRDLIDKLIPQVSPHHRDTIRRYMGDSYLAAVVMCTSVARQKTLPQTLGPRHLRDYVLHQPVARAVRDLCPPEQALRGLAVYSACTPVRLGDSSVRQSAAIHSGLSLSDIEVLEQRVLQAGLLQVYGRDLVRPVPDLLGDLVLEDTCLDEQGKPTSFGQALTRQLFDQDPGAVIRNCAAIGRLFSTVTSADLVSTLVLERAAGARPEGEWNPLQLLNSCGPLASRQPGTLVRLVAMLEAQGILRHDPPARELDYTDNLERAAQTLLMSASEHDPTVVRRAMEYSQQLWVSSRADPGSYAAIRGSLSAFCRFAIGRPIAHSRAVLEVLQVWAVDADVARAELAASLIQEFLPLEAHGHRWEEGALVPLTASIIASDELWQLRDRAIALLVGSAHRAEPGVQYAAAGALQHWAAGYGGLAADPKKRWEPQLERELQVLAESFSNLGATTPHLPVRAAIEHQGWRWWANDVNAFIQGGGRRILQGLPAGNPYSLWKALHDDTLPVITVAPDDAVAGQDRRAYFLAITNPTSKSPTEAAGALFNELDPVHGDVAAWSALFASVLLAVPKHRLQTRAAVYLAEFGTRHPDEAWSFVNEASAEGPLGMIVPALLAELRKQDPTRWQALIRRVLPGTRLFDAALRAVWGTPELDSVERAMVSQGLELDDATAIHLSAQTLLNVTVSDLAPGLEAVFAVLRIRPTDERLWELTIDAFARWGSSILSAPPDVEPDSRVRAMAGEFLSLFRTSRTTLSWGHGPHTRGLATVLAIFAAAVPHTLKSWMREVWGTTRDPEVPDALPLSTTHLSEVVRLIAGSSVAPYWQKQFGDWIVEESGLAPIGAQGLAELCGLGDPYVAALIERVGQQPTDDSLAALGEFIGRRGNADQPLGQVAGERKNALAAIDKWMESADLAPTLRETLLRARGAIAAAVD